MLDRLSHAIAARASTPAIVLLLLISAAILWRFSAYELPGGFLDLRWHYDAEAARAAMSAYGEAGRARYLEFLALDAFFPWFYGAALALLLSRAAAVSFAAGSRWRRVNLLPLLTLLADSVENACLYWMLTRYPDFADAIATLAGHATTLKHLTLLAAVGLLCAAGFGWLRRRRG
jgi:hypothetical protein